VRVRAVVGDDSGVYPKWHTDVLLWS